MDGFHSHTSYQGRVTLVSIPYSEHSSFTELCECVRDLQPKQIVPTVNAYSKDAMEKLVDLFTQYRGRAALQHERGKLDKFLVAKKGEGENTHHQNNPLGRYPQSIMTMCTRSTSPKADTPPVLPTKVLQSRRISKRRQGDTVRASPHSNAVVGTTTCASKMPTVIDDSDLLSTRIDIPDVEDEEIEVVGVGDVCREEQTQVLRELEERLRVRHAWKGLLKGKRARPSSGS